MKIDKLRVKKFLSEIQRDTWEIEEFLKEDLNDKRTIKAIRYNLIEIIEAQANILQHILAKDRGLPSSGYIEVIERAKGEGIISRSIYAMLKPFFEFETVAKVAKCRHSEPEGRRISTMGEILRGVYTERSECAQDDQNRVFQQSQFRNTLVHRYWTIDDRTLIENLKERHRGFYNFIKEIEGYLKRK